MAQQFLDLHPVRRAAVGLTNVVLCQFHYRLHSTQMYIRSHAWLLLSRFPSRVTEQDTPRFGCRSSATEPMFDDHRPLPKRINEQLILEVCTWFCVSCAALHTAEGTRAPVHRYDDVVDEARAGTAQPDQVIRLAETSGRRMVDDRLATRGYRPGLVEQRARFCPPTKKPGAIALTRVSGVFGEGF